MMEYIKTSPITDFENLREEFLKEIELRPTQSLFGDYNVNEPFFSPYTNRPENRSSRYVQLFLNMITEPVEKYIKSWGCPNWDVVTVWCHQYNDGGEYIHHTHSRANMAGVIHLVLDDEQDYTNIEGYEEPIKEGEVILFPSMQPHKCDPVHSRKITINFNWDMHGDMDYYHPVQ